MTSPSDGKPATIVIREPVKIALTDAIEALQLSEFAKRLDFSAGPDDVVYIQAAHQVSIAAFDDDAVQAEHERRFGIDRDVIGDLYRMLADGDAADAMDLMAREFGLSPPAHEKKLAGLIARGRAKEASHAEN